mgnify:CR=1 FL=1
MLALLSNGITSEKLHNELCKHIKGTKAAIVITADNEYKSENYHIPRCTKELNALGLTAQLFDFDIQNAAELLKYDVVYIIGGNPYYLLNSIRKTNAEAILKQIAEEKVLIGWSAGALVLTPSIAIIDKYSPEMNIFGISDLSGLCLTDSYILPHYSKFLNRYENFEEKCKQYELDNRLQVIRLNDGEGVLIVDDKQIFIKD